MRLHVNYWNNPRWTPDFPSIYGRGKGARGVNEGDGWDVHFDVCEGSGSEGKTRLDIWIPEWGLLMIKEGME